MPRYRITTPELVDFDYQTAGLVTRSFACLIDQILLSVFTLTGVYVVSILRPILVKAIPRPFSSSSCSLCSLDTLRSLRSIRRDSLRASNFFVFLA